MKPREFWISPKLNWREPIVIEGYDPGIVLANLIHVREVLPDEPKLATADICPHGGSSTLCEWCQYKVTQANILEQLIKWRELAEELAEALKQESDFVVNCFRARRSDKVQIILDKFNEAKKK